MLSSFVLIITAMHLQVLLLLIGVTIGVASVSQSVPEQAEEVLREVQEDQRGALGQLQTDHVTDVAGRASDCRNSASRTSALVGIRSGTRADSRTLALSEHSIRFFLNTDLELEELAKDKVFDELLVDLKWLAVELSATLESLIPRKVPLIVHLGQCQAH